MDYGQQTPFLDYLDAPNVDYKWDEIEDARMPSAYRQTFMPDYSKRNTEGAKDRSRI